MKGFSFLKKRGGMFFPLSCLWSAEVPVREAWLVILREALVVPTEASVDLRRSVYRECMSQA